MLMETVLSRSLRVMFSGSVAVGLGLIAQPVLAQEDTSKIQRVEITGSNIKRSEAETIASTQILTRKDIEQSGKTSVSDVIRSISADNNGTISGAFANGFAGSASGVSLRGLSVNGTLVLINGRRTAPYGFSDDGQRSFVDLNSIPLDAVDRIEVLKDGASAIYGSDAIGGVVNVILRTNYQGKSVSATIGQSGKGDGTIKRGSATLGFGDLDNDKFNLFFNVDAQKQDDINQRNRGAYIGNADARPWGGRDQRGGVTTSSNTGGNSLTGTVRPVSATGATIPGRGIQNLPGCDPATIDRTSPNNGGGGCMFDPIQQGFQQIQPKTQNINVFSRLTVNLGDATQAYAEGGVFNSRASTISGPSGLTGSGYNFVTNRVFVTGTGPDQLLLPIGHPDNPFPNNRARPRFLAQTEPRLTDLDTTVTRFLAGVKGTFGAWDYDTAILHAESRTDRVQNGYVRQSALAAGVADGSYRIGNNFGLSSPATLAAVYPTLTNQGVSKLSSVDFKATRQFGQLPGGAIGIAVGGEVRRESSDSQPTPFTITNDIAGLSYSASSGSRTVSALYAELALPVLKSLEFQLAARTDHYSDSGTSTTPKVGFKYTPLRELAFRGTYAEGFRAPSFAENGNSSSSFFTNVSNDPVRCPVTHTAADCGTQQIGGSTGGNKDIKPETSKSYSLGLIIEPIKNTSMSIDLWKIVRKNEITATDPGSVLANPSAFPAAVITRGEPTSDFPGLVGPILLIQAPYVNAGQTKTSGIDLDLRTRIDLKAAGRLNLGLNVTQMVEFTRTSSGISQAFVGTHGDTNLSGDGGTPRTRASATAGWERGPWSAASTLNYVSSLDNVNERGGDCLDINPVSGVPYLNCKVASFTTVDLFGKYKVNKQWEVSASVANLFDRMAPLDVQTYGRINYNPSLHQSGAVGRYFTVSSRYTF